MLPRVYKVLLQKAKEISVIANILISIFNILLICLKKQNIFTFLARVKQNMS